MKVQEVAGDCVALEDGEASVRHQEGHLTLGVEGCVISALKAAQFGGAVVVEGS